MIFLANKWLRYTVILTAEIAVLVGLYCYFSHPKQKVKIETDSSGQTTYIIGKAPLTPSDLAKGLPHIVETLKGQEIETISHSDTNGEMTTLRFGSPNENPTNLSGVVFTYDSTGKETVTTNEAPSAVKN